MSDAFPELMTIFGEALDRSDPVSRSVYLDQACFGKPDLRKQVERLLEAHQRSGSFLNPETSFKEEEKTDLSEDASQVIPERKQPLTDIATGAYLKEELKSATYPISDFPIPAGYQQGEIIAGRYTLIGVLGEGGMGTVYRASQVEPVKRQVALKLIRKGMDTKGVLARFDAERQALALMDHPNIARVYDGGTTPTGQPFFVMELVSGIPITEFCDQRRLPVRGRLEIFVSVCMAVQHAHQKGVIHRDLKPANILVTEVDGRPAPKVIDFGVAKATEMKLTDKSFADGEAIVGTPTYMSPEQADPTSMDIDTRTDVYALGVILYELLVGSPPIDAKQFKRGAILEMLRMVREVDPPRPSTKVSSSEALPSIAAVRAIDPVHLKSSLQGDLDWIVMKALEKDRTRRYETVNGFAADVLRHLAYEPVLAAPPSRTYLMWKFVRKNRTAVMASCLVLLALLLGILGTGIGMYRAILAKNEAVEQKEKTTEALVETTKARDLVQREKKEKEKELERAEWLLYASRISLTQKELELENIDEATGLLNSTRTDFRNWEFDYLNSEKNSGQDVCDAPTIRAISRDGKLLASHNGGSWKTTIWDMKTGKLVLTLNHMGDIYSLAFSPDGKRLISGGGIANNHDKPADLKIWDLETGKVVFDLKGHTPPVSFLSLSPDGKTFASLAGNMYGKRAELKIWDFATGKELLDIKEPGKPALSAEIVGGLAYSPDGKRIATGLEKKVQVWTADTGKEILSFGQHPFVLKSLAYSPDGKRIATRAYESKLKIWDAQTGRETLAIDSDEGVEVAFSPDSKLISSPSGQLVKVWDCQTGKELHSFKTGLSKGLAFTLDGKNLAVAAGDKVQLWGLLKSRGDLTFKASDYGTGALAMSPDGKRIATSSGIVETTVKVWDTRTGKKVFDLNGHFDFASGLAFSPDGKKLASASRDGTTRIWNMDTGKIENTFPCQFPRQMGIVAFSPDGNNLATNDGDKSVCIWNLNSRKKEVSLNVKTELVLCLAFNLDGKTLAIGCSGDAPICLWDMQPDGIPATLPGNGQSVFGLNFHPDGQTLASCSLDQTIKIWNLKTGKETLTMKGHTGTVVGVAFHPDGHRIASAGQDGTVRLWESKNGFETIILRVSREPLSALAFSKDGKRLGCGDLLGMVKIWNAETKTQNP